MPTGHKIALFGIGSIGKIILSGTAALTVYETKKENFDFDIQKITTPSDYNALIRAYKEVQRKYYPEKDVFNNK